MPSRAARLLQLLERLRAHRQPVPGAALAAELGISLRTLYRDVSTLREQGARIDGDPGVGYLLRPGFTLPPLMFSEDELEALILGARWVANHAADPELAQAAHGVMNRIGNVLPPALRLAVETSGLFVPPPHDCYRPAPRAVAANTAPRHPRRARAAARLPRRGRPRDAAPHLALRHGVFRPGAPDRRLVRTAPGLSPLPRRPRRRSGRQRHPLPRAAPRADSALARADAAFFTNRRPLLTQPDTGNV